MMPGPRLVPVDQQQQQQVGEECERGEDCYQGRDQAQSGNEIMDRPVKPSSAGIPLSLLDSDTVVTDMEPISANIYQEEGERRQETGGC